MAKWWVFFLHIYSPKYVENVLNASRPALLRTRTQIIAELMDQIPNDAVEDILTFVGDLPFT